MPIREYQCDQPSSLGLSAASTFRVRAEREEPTEGGDALIVVPYQWHRVVVWGKQGTNCSEMLKKGRPVYVEAPAHALL